MVGDIVCGSAGTWSESQLKARPYSSPSIQQWEKAFVSITLSLNLLCTGPPPHILSRPLELIIVNL
jgi:hypothetical protein